MNLLIAFFIPALVFSQTPSPTRPTPYPTITPAPTSDCQYNELDEGPFALDCLQQKFLEVCTIRGDSYPTETRLDTDTVIDTSADKQWYNANTWEKVIEEIGLLTANVKDTNAADHAAAVLKCRGADTHPPTPNPTLSPTSLVPSPVPTHHPTGTEDTPAPTYAQDYKFRLILDNDLSGPNTGAGRATMEEELEYLCTKKGYNRDYDDTSYIIKIVVAATDGSGDEFVDYFTSSDEICDMLADPVGKNVQWSDRPEGPFQLVTTAAKDDFQVMGTPKTPDGRAYPSWLSDGNGGTLCEANTCNGSGTGNKPYKLYISSKRQYYPCTEQRSPLTSNKDPDSPVFQTRCTRDGSNSQKWGSDAVTGAKVCDYVDIADNMLNKLHYAIANNMFATCDAECIWSVDYVKGAAVDASDSEGTFWEWKSGADNCWKPMEAFGVGEFMKCNAAGVDFETASPEIFTRYQHVLLEQARLCTPRCHYIENWELGMGSCYRLATGAEFAGETGANNAAKGIAFCNSLLPDNTGANQASINSKEENQLAALLCGDTENCFFGGITGRGTVNATFADGKRVEYVNFDMDEETAGAGIADDQLVMRVDSGYRWGYDSPDQNFNMLCEADAADESSNSGRDQADICRKLNADVNNERLDTSSFPNLEVADSGFTESDAPNVLVLIVTVPKTMYDVKISFENSTNDEAEYSWQWQNARWSVDNDDNCQNEQKFTGRIPWTIFNLGGAGGVQRLATYENTGANSPYDTTEDADESTDTDNRYYYYQFGSVIRVEAMQPLHQTAETLHDLDVSFRNNRLSYFEREVVVRVPFILRFQKSITVKTDVTIISTKFNYKTVAAIIQSVQYDTQYYEHPYAKLKVQIRTKSQYPYLFNIDEGTITLHSGQTGDEDADPALVDLSIVHLADDVNCTFQNPDHMREGDICTQEWMLTIEPNKGQCYATGEYSIEYTAGCFYGKDVCYLPQDSNGDDITSVTFTFKLQTSKFCPQVADVVDLSGQMVCTGRDYFKPSGDKEDNTEGSFYMQSEEIHFFATTESAKAKIVATEVVLIELKQDLGGLVQTGYNRVPYDVNTEHVVVWMKKNANDERVADGTITVNDGIDSNEVQLTDDTSVFKTGQIPTSPTRGDAEEVFGPREAGFRIKLHARAFPVNVDSFGDKTIYATLEVTYDKLTAESASNRLGRRRRLLANSPRTEARTATRFKMQAWAPKKMPAGMGRTASMSMELTIDSKQAVNRATARYFAHSVQNAIVTSLNEHPDSHTVFDAQVAIDNIFANGIRIWSRPMQGQEPNRRRLPAQPQKLKVFLTFANVAQPNAMPLDQMIKIFDLQLRSPASPLLHQPVFNGAVIHEVEEVITSNYQPPNPSHLTSSAAALVPFVILSFVAALF